VNSYKYSFFVSAFIMTLVLLAASSINVQAMDLPIGTHTNIYLTARVQNKWWYAGNLQCKSATLETLGQTYTAAIAAGSWWGMAGNESCFITFAGVPTPLALTPARVTVRYYTLAGDQLVDTVTSDRLQSQQEDYFLQLTWYDDYVILDDMILNDTATVPIIQVDPTALPKPPPLPPIPDLP
jgi:hypothetical protein